MPSGRKKDEGVVAGTSTHVEPVPRGAALHDAESASFGHTPFVPADTFLREITPKAIVLGALLSMLLASANVYLGLFAGLTVSASIPAAVISMGVLRLFRERNILENNIVQTATSAGESLAAGVIFTIPALVILGRWDSFLDHALETIIIAAFAGVLGVAFTIPLRRAFIVEAKLEYPEGVACAEVLEVGEEGGRGVLVILAGGIAGALYKFATTGFQIWGGLLEGAARVGNAIAYFGINLSPALVGVGYIIGLRIATVVFAGGVIAWLVAMPIYTATVGMDTLILGFRDTFVEAGVVAAGVSDSALVEAVSEDLHNMALLGGLIWSAQIRYMGVGAMAVGGLWALVQLRKPLVSGMRSGLEIYQRARFEGVDDRIRTERDLTLRAVAIVAVIAAIPLFGIFWTFLGEPFRALLMTVVMLIAGFLFSSVAAYMAGVVGSSNNPISGVTIATALFVGATLWLTGVSDEIGTIATVAVAAVIASAAAIGGDNMQDLKTGYLLGSTPRNQQIMQMVGVVSAALVLPFVLELILQGFGICGAPGSDANDCLAAPQANLIGTVSGGFFGQSIPWGMAAIGALIAVGIILVDEMLRVRGSTFRTPVLAVAVGIYLPLELTSTIFIGGLLHFAVLRTFQNRAGADAADTDARARVGLRDGILLASGLIAGEAIMGILLGIPRLPVFAPEGNNPLALSEWAGLGLPGPIPLSGALVFGFICYLVYYTGIRPLKMDVEPADPMEFEER